MGGRGSRRAGITPHSRSRVTRFNQNSPRAGVIQLSLARLSHNKAWFMLRAPRGSVFNMDEPTLQIIHQLLSLRWPPAAPNSLSAPAAPAVSDEDQIDLYLEQLAFLQVPQPFEFSAREQQVLGHVLGGQTNHEIARQLCVSTRTIANHRSALLRKTESRNTADLVRKVMLSLMVDLSEAEGRECDAC